MTGTLCWAMSPADYRVHQVEIDNNQAPDVLKARCSLQLPVSVTPQDQPPPGPRCQRCDVLGLAGIVPPLQEVPDDADRT